MKKIFLLWIAGCLSGLTQAAWAQQPVQTAYHETNGQQEFVLSNDKVVQKVFIDSGELAGDMLSGQADWLATYHNAAHAVQTDGDFALKLMWTDWAAPGNPTNADVQVTYSKKDFLYQAYAFHDIKEGGKELELYFSPKAAGNSMSLKLTYQLMPGKFYARRSVSVRDSLKQTNWLDAFDSRQGEVADAVGQQNSMTMMRRESGPAFQAVQKASTVQGDEARIIKKGAFGQPCALDFREGGVFFGIEYPAATNTLQRTGDGSFQLQCNELIGTVIQKDWVSSQWVVEGLAPDHYVKDWFFNYLPDVRVAANRPYTLYNSWYDLRSPEYPGVQPDHVMNEKNILHIIDLFKKNMIDKYGIHLDAFVLDDGWDVYESDWQLRKTTFSHGLKPISDELKTLGTTLGIWYGPTGGYSFHSKRINWMKAHGYEVIGYGSNNTMLCIAGKNYSDLFRKRTTDMVRNDGVGYFKWDGIQFSCSEPDHGHPVGYHSRRAVLESVIDKCKAVRAINPNTFLNITSGTWLSPWWVKYANQIWMQGEDYGYADVPSVNERDGAITYRDFVLYDDLHNQDVWFPVSNMMTHGIIKGNLEKLGGDDDPLDRFTDDVMLYFARGVSMYEMYISPDLLTPAEWNVLSKSLNWAKDRFPLMDKTDMIGGDPTQGQTYGYVHFKGDKGVIAARNPDLAPSSLLLKLDPAKGLSPEASSLVLEQVYPVHWVSPQLYSAGAEISLPLNGYEAAVYEVYPLKDAQKPLLADVQYESIAGNSQEYNMQVLHSGKDVHLLNPGLVSDLSIDGKNSPLNHIGLPAIQEEDIATAVKVEAQSKQLSASFNLDKNDVLPRFAVFLRPDSSYKGKNFPDISLQVDGKKIAATKQVQQGYWAVYSYVLPDNGAHHATLDLSANDKTRSWSGEAECWLISQQKQKAVNITVKANSPVKEAPMPPSPFETSALKKNEKLGTAHLQL